MVVLVTSQTLFPFIVGKYVYFRILVDLAFIFFLLGLLFNQQESVQIGVNQRFKQLIKNPLVIAVSAFIFFFLLACLFGFDPQYSFWSNFERGEGGLQLLHFYVFFALLALLFREEKDWQKIFTMTIVGGLGMAFYGLLAGWGAEGFIGPKFGDPDFRFYGSIGNPAYVAAYAIFMLFYSAYLLISKYKDKLLSFGAIVLWLLMVVFLVVFFAAATRGAFVGLIAAVLAFISYLAFSSKRWRKWLISGAAILILLVVLSIQFKNVPLIKSSPVFSRILDISFTTKTFEDRMTIWKMAFDGWKERPILGWGPENFIQVFDRDFNIKYFKPAEGFGAWFDRAHSIYLDYLVETGILGLLSYLGIFIVFYWQLLWSSRINTDKEQIYTDKKSVSISQNPYKSVLVKGLLFAIPIAYLVQGIVLFDVSPIYLNLFLLFGFAVYKFTNNHSLKV